MHDVLEALRRHAAATPGALALAVGETRIDYQGLLALVTGAAAEIEALPRNVGVAGPNGLAWVVADLALIWTGRRLVPIPPFFSAGQTAHLIADAGIGHVIWSGDDPPDPGMATVDCTVGQLSLQPGTVAAGPVAGADRVIYTSGTTGRPKGVLHGARQMNFITRALADAVDASARDRHLSCLPFALLLEQLCGIHLPLLVGGRTHISQSVAGAAAIGSLGPLAETMDAVRPSTAVLIPQQLTGLVATLAAAGRLAPDSLRFVAVGGAPVSPDLIARATALGLPVHEGYGLSECCSVVSLNRPGKNAPGTAGPPLAGLRVRIDDGEIVVHGPSVMAGYLHHTTEEAGGEWRTGDLGSIDSQGRLTVHGRRDGVIVTAQGRNISPEWIEALLLADPRIARAVVMGHGLPGLVATIWPSATGRPWFAGAGPAALGALVSGLTAGAPGYARPGTVLIAGGGDLSPSLFTPSGRPRRPALAAHFADRLAHAFAPVEPNTMRESA